MKNFWTLSGFEFRKILAKKSVMILLFLAMAASVFSNLGTLMGYVYIDGKQFETSYEGMVKDREYARKLNGKVLDDRLLLEAAEAYGTIPSEISSSYLATEEYQKNARAYSEIYRLARAVYSQQENIFDAGKMGKLSKTQAENYYEQWRENIRQDIEQSRISESAKEKLLDKTAQIKTPWIFSYTDGYGRFFSIMYTSGIIAAFCMAVCVAPLFAGEYSSGSDQLILTSRHGKGTVIKAKLFAGFSLSIVISLIFTLQTYVQSMLVFGSDGKDCAIQLYHPAVIWPLTIGQAALFQSICVFAACMMTTSVTMFLSAKLKSSFGVIILVTVLLIFPMMVHVSEEEILLYRLYNLLPASMIPFWGFTNKIPYEIFGFVIPPYLYMPFTALLCSAAFIPLTFRAFRRRAR